MTAAIEETPTTTITKADAGELWIRLRDSWAVTAAMIRKIIETKAWEPLGYASFGAAWRAEIGFDEAIAKPIAEMVAVQMAKDGATDAEILDLRAIGPRSLPAIREAVSVGRDKPVVRRATMAELPSTAYRILVDFAPEERARFARLAEQNGSSLNQEAEKAIRAWFDRVEKRLGSK